MPATARLRPELSAALAGALAVMLLVMSAGAALATQRFALVIGNSAYQTIGPLSNPERDAALVGKALADLDFRTTTLTNLDLTGFKRAIAAFTEEVGNAGPDAIALVYYAGHGVQIDGVNYLVPVDASAKSASGVVLSSVSAADLLRALEDAAAETNVVILDACRDNPFKSGTRGFNRGLAQISAPSGTIIAYATAPGQTASDGRGDNSPYAAALAKNMGAPGIALEEVFKRVRVDVNVETNGNQTPWEETSLTRNIELVPAAQPAPATVPGGAAAGTVSEIDVKRAYLKAVNANSVEAYDAFIAAFPHSEQAVQALKNIEALSDEKNWREAVSQNTVGAYVLYVSLHRDGNYVDEANAKIAAMRQPPRQVDATPQTLAAIQVPPPAEDLTIKPGFDIYGADYRVVKDVGFNDCLSACRTDSACQALTYSRSTRWCFLKRGSGLLLRNANADSAVAASLAGQLVESRIEVFTRTDMSGGDYMNFEATDFKGCLMQCENDGRCAAFSYVRKERWCWLKDSVSEQKSNRKVDSGIKR